jgi:hypothetical protein
MIIFYSYFHNNLFFPEQLEQYIESHKQILWLFHLNGLSLHLEFKDKN